MMLDLDPELDLQIDGVIRAPRTRVWKAWTDPEPGVLIMFTNALDSRWRPTNPAPVSMVAKIRFGDHPQGTDYRVIVRHADARSRTHHEQLGFE